MKKKRKGEVKVPRIYFSIHPLSLQSIHDDTNRRSWSFDYVLDMRASSQNHKCWSPVRPKSSYARWMSRELVNAQTEQGKDGPGRNFLEPISSIAQKQTWDICGRGLKSFGSTQAGHSWFNKWQISTPSRRACAKSKAVPSLLVALWSDGRIWHCTSHSTHCLHSSAAIFVGLLFVFLPAEQHWLFTTKSTLNTTRLHQNKIFRHALGSLSSSFICVLCLLVFGHNFETTQGHVKIWT